MDKRVSNHRVLFFAFFFFFPLSFAARWDVCRSLAPRRAGDESRRGHSPREKNDLFGSNVNSFLVSRLGQSAGTAQEFLSEGL
jgi:hypothetical protein